MDFHTMRKRLRNAEYPYVDIFERDFETICQNAMIYNAPETIFYKEAEKLLQTGKQIIKNTLEKIDPEKMKSSTPLPPLQTGIEPIPQVIEKKEKQESAPSTPVPTKTTPQSPATKSRTKVKGAESTEKQAEKLGLSSSIYNVYIPKSSFMTDSYNMYNSYVSNYLNYGQQNLPKPPPPSHILKKDLDQTLNLQQYLQSLKASSVEPLKSYIESLKDSKKEEMETEPIRTEISFDKLRNLSTLSNEGVDLSFLQDIEPSLKNVFQSQFTPEQLKVQDQLDRNFQLLYFLQLSSTRKIFR